MKTLRTFLVLSVLVGVLYPLAITAAAKVLAPPLAPVGQTFSEPGHFWSRLSAGAYSGTASGGSNFGPSNEAQRKAAQERLDALRAADPEADAPVPVDLVTASASGLDPHISPAAAAYQVRRVARARRLPEAEVQRLVAAHTEGRTFGLLGEPRVDVVALNRELDRK